MSSACVKRAKPSSATTVREVVRAVSTRDGVDARNVNGEVAMDVDARRVDLVEATLATCRAAEKAMFEATSARECAEATACARAAFEIARATGERRSTRDRARASGAFEAVSSLARACAACAACRAGSRRGDAGGGAWAAARWETDARDVVALVRALVRASGEDVRLFDSVSVDEGGEGNAGECLTCVALASDCSDDVDHRVACLEWFTRIWFDEASEMTTSRVSKSEIASARAVCEGAVCALRDAARAGEDADDFDFKTVAQYALPVANYLRFVALSDHIDDYFDSGTLGGACFARVLEIFSDIASATLRAYRTRFADMDESMAVALVHVLDVIELFTADTNAYKMIGQKIQDELVETLRSEAVDFAVAWTDPRANSSVVRLLVQRPSHAGRPTHALSLYRIIGNLHDSEENRMDSDLSRTVKTCSKQKLACCVANAKTLAEVVESADSEFAPTSEERESFAHFLSCFKK